MFSLQTQPINKHENHKFINLLDRCLTWKILCFFNLLKTNFILFFGILNITFQMGKQKHINTKKRKANNKYKYTERETTILQEMEIVS